MFTTRRLLVGARLSSYVLVALLGCVVLGLASYLESLQQWKPAGLYILPFVSALLTVLILSPMVALDRLRRDAAVHQPRIELVWAGFVTLLWLASSLLYSLQLRGLPRCSTLKGAFFAYKHTSEFTWCQVNIAMKWILWTGFILLCCTVTGILTFAFINDGKGYPEVWVTSISDFERHPKRPATSARSQANRRHSARMRDLELTLAQLQQQQQEHPSQTEFQRRYEAAAARARAEGIGDQTPPSETPGAGPRPPSPSLSVRSAMRALGYTPPRPGNPSRVGFTQNSSQSLVAGVPGRPGPLPRAEGSQNSFQSGLGTAM